MFWRNEEWLNIYACLETCFESQYFKETSATYLTVQSKQIAQAFQSQLTFLEHEAKIYLKRIDIQQTGNPYKNEAKECTITCLISNVIYSW